MEEEVLIWVRKNPPQVPLYNEAQVLVRVPDSSGMFGYRYFIGKLLELYGRYAIIIDHGDAHLTYMADEVDWAFLG